MMIYRANRWMCFLLLMLLYSGSITWAVQKIVLDKTVRAGSLIFFPELGNEKNYYYVSDKLSLGTHKNGLPQFSLLRYCRLDLQVQIGLLFSNSTAHLN